MQIQQRGNSKPLNLSLQSYVCIFASPKYRTQMLNTAIDTHESVYKRIIIIYTIYNILYRDLSIYDIRAILRNKNIKLRVRCIYTCKVMTFGKRSENPSGARRFPAMHYSNEAIR
ncbi:hypothetical protein PUN28_009855 [Cardiocondyla obscurior]|uniref:Uncharacterized protein n=1 Tax=Cardiocondyla obscurior TaxID=286306 RepID=A0AAW2FM25_9HYME